MFFGAGRTSTTQPRRILCGVTQFTGGMCSAALFVLSYTDNTNVLAAMRSMGSSSRRMQELLARRTAWMLRKRVVEASARITTDNNVWADWGSRGRLAELVAAARRMGLRARRVAMPPDWRDTAALRALLPDSLE